MHNIRLHTSIQTVWNVPKLPQLPFHNHNIIRETGNDFPVLVYIFSDSQETPELHGHLLVFGSSFTFN